MNDVRWHEVPSLFGRGPDERIYVTRLDDDGTTIVPFGDGDHGARLPPARRTSAPLPQGHGPRRRGQGRSAQLLMTRPLGVKGADQSGRGQRRRRPRAARRRAQYAPLTVLTLGRASPSATTRTSRGLRRHRQGAGDMDVGRRHARRLRHRRRAPRRRDRGSNHLRDLRRRAAERRSRSSPFAVKSYRPGSSGWRRGSRSIRRSAEQGRGRRERRRSQPFAFDARRSDSRWPERSHRAIQRAGRGGGRRRRASPLRPGGGR